MRLGFVVCVTMWGAAGCVSNPTPHPGVADTHVGAADANWAGAGPDKDNDGVPDCDEAGGVWTGSGCDLAEQPVGTADVAYDDGESGDPSEVVEVVEADVGAEDATGASEAGPSD